MAQIATRKADNYHRWWGVDWAYLEKGGEEHHGVWGKEQVSRLNEVVQYGHGLGYLMSFYCLDGFTAAENQGWEDEYNFGSTADALPRWKAVIRARADILSTDQYEAVAKQIRAR